jgi:eukaryotic-like serine/threonine-protein kinase
MDQSSKPMALFNGTRLGPYEIVAPLGAGGMGEVYLAEDTRLDRKVALKLLPTQFTADADRVRRFVQEAKAASALNHPNILTIYDIGTHEGAPYIVSELLEGETLRQRGEQEPIPVRKAMDYAVQIVRGLTAAHGKGIVHRDLKPENLFICQDGRVKILDFGLAKLKASSSARGIGPETPTLAQTQPGVVMGTVAYMSPEQVRGQDADHRADIFAFGVILYEMVAGKRAFVGETAAETMTAILKQDPPAMAETNRQVSPGLERLVRHCVEKRPEERFQSASDLAFALEALSGISGESVVTGLKQPDSPAWYKRRERWAWIAAGVFLIGLLASLPFTLAYLRQTPAEVRLIKLSLPPPEKASLGSIAVSPDGRWLAFTAATGGNDQLWVRALDALTAQALPGTEGARYPFWSPDSRSIGFFTGGKLKKMEFSGGPVQTLCDAGTALDGTWNRDGVIVFATRGFGLYRVSVTGGNATLMVSPDWARQEIEYRSPCFLPDGRHFLYYIGTGRKEIRGVYLGLLDGGVKQRLLGAESNAVYAPPALLLFVRDGALLAQSFDARELRLSGDAFPVAERVGRDQNILRGNFSVSESGVLVYDPSVNRQSKQLVWVDRGGKQIRSLGAVGSWTKPRLSPDEKRVAADRLDSQTLTLDLWLYDVTGVAGSRFTFDPADDLFPVWSPDGSRIVWSSNRDGTNHLYQKGASGAGQDALLLKSNNRKFPTDWSLDGRFIIYYEINPKTKRDIWVLPLFGDQKPFPFLQTEANEVGAQLSPDGRWMAYISDETGEYEVYVRSFPEARGQRQISTKGGSGPHWRRDGKELFYYAPDGKLMAVEVKSVLPAGGHGSGEGATFESGVPHALFEFRSGNAVYFHAPYTVTADGQRFLLNTLVDESGGAPLTVVINWTEGLKKN